MQFRQAIDEVSNVVASQQTYRLRLEEVGEMEHRLSVKILPPVEHSGPISFGIGPFEFIDSLAFPNRHRRAGLRIETDGEGGEQPLKMIQQLDIFANIVRKQTPKPFTEI